MQQESDPGWSAGDYVPEARPAVPEFVPGHGAAITADAEADSSHETLELVVSAARPADVLVRVRDVLLALPDVTHVHAIPGETDVQFAVSARSVPALLDGIMRSPALDGATVLRGTDGRLLLQLPDLGDGTAPQSTPAATATVEPPDPAPHPPSNGVVGGGSTLVTTAAAHPHQARTGSEERWQPSFSGEPARSTGRKRRRPPSLTERFSEQLDGEWGRTALIVLGAAALLVVVLAVALLRRSSSPADPRAVAQQPTAVSATPASTTSATTASGRALTRPLDSVCLVPPERRPCDAEAEARWNGNLAAWQAFAARTGQPPPDASAALANALRMRMDVYDPPTRIQTARATGTAAVVLTSATFLPAQNRAGTDVQVEIANLGVAAADLSGARIVDQHFDLLLLLPPGASLPPGGRCRLSTGPAAENPCSFQPSASRRLPDEGPLPLQLTNASGGVIDVLDLPPARR